MNPYAPPTATDEPPRSRTISSADALEIRRRIRTLNTRSFLLGVPGLILQPVGNAMQSPLISLVGFGLLVAGLVSYATMRGRHPAFGALGLLSCLGLVILGLLPKKCLNCETSHSFRAHECRSCGAPLGS